MVSKIFASMEPYLTDEARAVRDQMVQVGFDADLAMAVLESVCTETIYDIPVYPEEINETPRRTNSDS